MRADATTPGSSEHHGLTPNDTSSRESTNVRASILDAAMDLGFGSNSTVAKWMFENQVEEEDDEESSRGLPSPAIIDGTSSEATTPATAAAHTTLPTSLSDHSYSMFPRSADTFLPRPMVQEYPRATSIPVDADNSQNSVTFVPTGPPKKLRKKPRPDGYESDGGYVSEAGRRGKASTKSSDKKEAREAKKEEREAKKEERKKKKEALKPDDSGYHTGYETDRASTGTRKSGKSVKSKKSMQKLTEAGYETDDGYTSAGGSLKPKKSRFFRLGKSKEAPMPMPELQVKAPEPIKPPMPLPIAQRFATTLQESASSPADSSDTASLQPSLVSQSTMVNSSRAVSSAASTTTSATTTSEDAPATMARQIPLVERAGILRDLSMDDAPRPSPTSARQLGHDTSFGPGTPISESVTGPSSPGSFKPNSPSKRHSMSKRSSLDFLTRPLSRMSSRRLSNASPPPSAVSKYPTISYPLTRSPSPPSSPTGPVYPPQFLNMEGDSPTSSPQEGRGFFGARSAPSPAPPHLDTQSPDTRSPNTHAQPAAYIPGGLPSTASHDGPRHPALLRDEKHRPEKIMTFSAHPGAAVLGRYDLPPPSPPPMAPLPSVPSLSALREATQDRSPMLEPRRPSPGLTRAASELDPRYALPRSPRLPPRSASENDHGFGAGMPSASPGRLSPLPPRMPVEQGSYMQPPPSQYGRESPMQRGRVSPFPQQPIRPGLEPRLMIPRSREQEYAAGAWDARATSSVEEPAESSSEDEWEHDDRYADAAEDDSGPVVRFDLPADRDRLSRVTEGGSVDDYYFNGRESRFTESVYSRASTLMDTERSGEVRSQLLHRVGEMYDSSGRERGAVPPVPKIPEAMLRLPGGLASRAGEPRTPTPEMRGARMAPGRF
ncbi:hypothetical protein BD626DRAFT_534763 [Schizophyllum amplum]|uniref:Uncharacterized protein n=1 Tax=Schizophyllum amplum TaxID=97359 RepID=A0A550CP70_9AGAR|nr:hypothetical protein BD626DRAFT_534763 [Auriculariopsis ampla]